MDVNSVRKIKHTYTIDDFDLVKDDSDTSRRSAWNIRHSIRL